MHQTTSCGATGGQACYWSWGWATGTGWWMVWQARWCQQLRGHNAGQNEWFGGCLLSLAIQPFQVVSKLRTQRHWVICWASKIVEEMTRGQCVWSLDSNNNDLQSALGIRNHCLKGSLLSQPSRKNIWFCGALHSFQKNCCLGDWVPDPRKLPQAGHMLIKPLSQSFCSFLTFDGCFRKEQCTCSGLKGLAEAGLSGTVKGI